MHWLSNLFRSPPPHTAESPGEVDATIFKGRKRRVEIVGEIYHERELAQVAGPKTPNGVSVLVDARLVPEPTNRHDRNAVAAVINGLTVGYLSREQAVNYHRAMMKRGFGGAPLVGFQARIRGGWLRPADELFGPDEGPYNVAMLLPESIAKEIGFGVAPL
jgi:hypothetical protein